MWLYPPAVYGRGWHRPVNVQLLQDHLPLVIVKEAVHGQVDPFLQVGLHEVPQFGRQLGEKLPDDAFRKDLHVILPDQDVLADLGVGGQGVCGLALMNLQDEIPPGRLLFLENII